MVQSSMDSYRERRWRELGERYLPRVGSLYRLREGQRSIWFKKRREVGDGYTSRKPRKMNSGDIGMLVWRTSLEDFVRGQMKLEDGNRARGRDATFWFRFLLGESVWEDKKCLLMHWERVFERMETDVDV